jgi:hypothetical protein
MHQLEPGPSTRSVAASGTTAAAFAVLALGTAGCGERGAGAPGDAPAAGAGGAAGAKGPGGASGAGGPPPAMPVTVVDATPRRLPITIEAVGQTEGSREVEVRARVTGVLQQQLFREGEGVKAGAPLFRIDPAPSRSRSSRRAPRSLRRPPTSSRRAGRPPVPDRSPSSVRSARRKPTTRARRSPASRPRGWSRRPASARPS